jgi:hypothetical protein
MSFLSNVFTPEKIKEMKENVVKTLLENGGGFAYKVIGWDWANLLPEFLQIWID